MSSTPENSDPYLYPGTNVLKNLRGLTDPEHLERFEARRTHQPIAELIDNPLSGGFDLAHLKAIHRYIFQDVYEWAGQFRTVNISKGGHLFGLADFLESSLQQVLLKLAAENHPERQRRGPNPCPHCGGGDAVLRRREAFSSAPRFRPAHAESRVQAGRDTCAANQ
jgi:fido (protein-threonine AMPylation protein)